MKESSEGKSVDNTNFSISKDLQNLDQQQKETNKEKKYNKNAKKQRIDSVGKVVGRVDWAKTAYHEKKIHSTIKKQSRSLNVLKIQKTITSGNTDSK